MSEQAKERRNWIGVSLLIIGAVFLSRNLNFELFHFPGYLLPNLLSWKIILIALGLLLLLTGRRSGIALIAIGVFFLFTNEIMMLFYNMGAWWPLLLIILGITLLLRPVRTSGNKGDTTVNR